MTDLDLADAVYGNAAVRLDTLPEPDIEDDPQTEEDHPLTIIIDTFIKTSDSYLKSKKKPQPNQDAYTALARPNLDEAFKQLLPVESDAKLNPYILLIMGIGGLGLVYAPLIIDIVDKKLSEEKPRKQLPTPPAPAPAEPEPESLRTDSPAAEAEPAPAGPLTLKLPSTSDL